MSYTTDFKRNICFVRNSLFYNKKYFRLFISSREKLTVDFVIVESIKSENGKALGKNKIFLE